jgi:hypothetical protein
VSLRRHHPAAAPRPHHHRPHRHKPQEIVNP